MGTVAIVSNWLGGSLPIFLIAWLARLPFRCGLTPTSVILSTLFAGIAGFFLRGFGDGQGGFESRLQSALSGEQIIFILPSALIVLAVLALLGWRQDRIATNFDRNE